MLDSDVAGKIGGDDYRNGALERLEDARRLLEAQRFGGSVILAGRAAEGALRGLLWHSDSEYKTGHKSLETGHDLGKLLRSVQRLGKLSSSGSNDTLTDAVQRVMRLWSNNSRYLPEERIETHWRNIGEVSNRRPLKTIADEFWDASNLIVKRCEQAWKKSK